MVLLQKYFLITKKWHNAAWMLSNTSFPFFSFISLHCIRFNYKKVTSATFRKYIAQELVANDKKKTYAPYPHWQNHLQLIGERHGISLLCSLTLVVPKDYDFRNVEKSRGASGLDNSNIFGNEDARFWMFQTNLQRGWSIYKYNPRDKQLESGILGAKCLEFVPKHCWDMGRATKNS